MSTPTPTRTDFCIFVRGDRRFAVSTQVAREVVEMRTPTPLPCSPPELLGGLNLRGEVVALLSLDTFLDLPPRPLAREDTLLVLERGTLRFAAAVDHVVRVAQFSPTDIRPQDRTARPCDGLFHGSLDTDGERIAVLDAEALVAEVARRIADGFRRLPLSAGPISLASTTSGRIRPS